MIPKSAKRFSDQIMFSLFRTDHVHDFGSARSEIIVVVVRAARNVRAAGKRVQTSRDNS
jgi:hypothetical protein